MSGAKPIESIALGKTYSAYHFCTSYSTSSFSHNILRDHKQISASGYLRLWEGQILQLRDLDLRNSLEVSVLDKFRPYLE